MADIYTPEWYAEVRDAMNARIATMKDLPIGELQIKVEIVGDGVSPYVAGDSERHFLVKIEDGRCAWYREVEGDDPEVTLNYRFRGAGTTFDEIAAGQQDPINAALKGEIKVRGDMRFLMRQAEQVKVLLEAYTTGVETSWPRGRPPYASSGQEPVSA
jgi:putative sterol carrier protein